MTEIFEKILSLPKSLYVSLRFFPLKEALGLPVLVRYNCKLLSLKGGVVIKSGGVRTAMFKIGFGHVGIFDKKYQRSILQIDGTIELKGKCVLGHGSRLCVAKDAVVSFGDNFCNMAEMNIMCLKRINFGNNVLVSWNTTVMDTDWHYVENVSTKEIYPKTKEIDIGNYVWLCMGCSVLKGAVIPDGCIVGANSVVTKKFDIKNAVLAGNPATIKKQGVTLYRNKQC